MDPLSQYAAGLNEAQVRYVVIGVWGAGYYSRGSVFLTEDQDLFLPPDPQNLRKSWDIAQSMGLQLRSGQDPLDEPRDEQLARAVVDRRALTRVTDGDKLDVDLSLVMTGFSFERVHAARRTFLVGSVEIPVAKLSHIVESKAMAGRAKDRLFLATHADALRRLLADDTKPRPDPEAQP